MTDDRRYAFGSFVLDAARRVLTRDADIVPLGDRALSVLVVLVENAGRPVPKRELLDTVWDDAVVNEETLARAVSDLRAALGDSAAAPSFIRTMHRRGYVFVADVAVVQGSDLPSRTPTRRRRAPGRVASVLAAVAVLGGLVVLLARTGRVADPPGRPFDGWAVRAAFGAPPEAFKPAFSPGGDLLVAVSPDPRNGVHSLFLVRPVSEEPVQLTRDIDVRGPAPTVSADGSSVLFTRYRHRRGEGLVPELWRVPVLGGHPRQLFDRVSAASPSPSGDAWAVSRVGDSATAIEVRRAGTEPVTVAERGFWPRWSPDGAWIAYTTSNPEGGDGHLWVVCPDGKDRRRLSTEAGQLYGLGWTPDSRHLVYALDFGGVADLWCVGVDGSDEHALTHGVGDCSCPVVRHDGREVVFAHGAGTGTVRLARDASDRLELVVREPGLNEVALSPDGSRLALTVGLGDHAAVAVLEIETRSRRVVSGLEVSHVRWSPDGRSLVCTAPSADRRATWVWRVPLGDGVPHPLVRGVHLWAWPDLSPEGSRIVAVRRRGGADELVVVDLTAGTERVLVTAPAIRRPRWSPDGRWVAWSGPPRPAELERGGVWLTGTAAAASRRLTEDGAWPVWVDGGRRLLYVRFLADLGVWSVDVSGGPPSLERDLVPLRHELNLQGFEAGAGGAPLVLVSYSGAATLQSLVPPAG